MHERGFCGLCPHVLGYYWPLLPGVCPCAKWKRVPLSCIRTGCSLIVPSGVNRVRQGIAVSCWACGGVHAVGDYTTGRCGCVQVAMVAAQHRTMIEAVENHMPEVVIVVRPAPACKPTAPSVTCSGPGTVRPSRGKGSLPRVTAHCCFVGVLRNGLVAQGMFLGTLPPWENVNKGYLTRALSHKQMLLVIAEDLIGNLS